MSKQPNRKGVKDTRRAQSWADARERILDMLKRTYKRALLPASKFADSIERPDFKPHHPERKKWMEDRRKKRVQTAQWLFRKYRHDKTALAIADRLDNCSDHNPCRSCACPTCYQAMANRFIDLASRFLSKQCPGDMSLQTITIVPNFGVLKGAALSSINYESFRRKMQLRLTKAGVGLMLGVFELSRDEHQTGKYPGCWILHLHGMLITDSPKSLYAELKNVFRKCELVPRPVKMKEWDGCEKWLEYWHKISGILRVEKEGKLSETTIFWKFGRAKRKDRLKSAHRLELLIHRHSTGFDQFLFTRKCQIRWGTNGPKLVSQNRSPTSKTPHSGKKPEKGENRRSSLQRDGLRAQRGNLRG